MKLDEIFSQLHELSNGDVEYTVTREIADVFQTKTMINGRTLKFGASGAGDSWDISFQEQLPTGNWTNKATGSGGAAMVLSFVVKSLQDFIARYSPQEITFSADKFKGESRANVYKRLLQRHIPGYDYVAKTETEGLPGHESEMFTLTRK